MYLSPQQLTSALELRDLSDPAQGPHAMQLLLGDVVDALQDAWRCTVRYVRNPAIVSVRDNYDRLGYDAGDVTRERRYSRYLSPTVMLRSHTSADLPAALEDYLGPGGIDELIVAPGLVYRRDAVDRTHVGAPHQVDLWRLVHAPRGDLEDMVGRVVEAVPPGARWRVTPARHPYTVRGLQVDVLRDGEWLELAECGHIHPGVLRRSGLDPLAWSGLALGIGLDRALMLRKGIPDIRYLRAAEPRIAAQMQDLESWRHVSLLPAATRDLSVVVDDGEDEETLGDRVRTELGPLADVIESLTVLATTPHDELPGPAQARLGTRPGQSNVLLRVALRPVDRTLTAVEANDVRNAIYRAVHQGPVMELV